MATVPALRTWTAGEIVTAAMLNANVRDSINYLLAPPAAALRQTSAQSLGNAAWTALTFDTEDVDNDNAHSTSTNTSRYVAQTAGWHRVNGGNVGFAANSTGRRGTRLAVNGSELNGGQCVGYIAGANAVVQAIVGRDVFLNVGDYLEVQAFQESGANLNTAVVGGQQPSLTVAWVRS